MGIKTQKSVQNNEFNHEKQFQIRESLLKYY